MDTPHPGKEHLKISRVASVHCLPQHGRKLFFPAPAVDSLTSQNQPNVYMIVHVLYHRSTVGRFIDPVFPGVLVCWIRCVAHPRDLMEDHARNDPKLSKVKYLLSYAIIIYIYTLWLFNIAMENDPFIDGLPGFTYSKWVDLSMATLVITKGYIYLYHSLCKGISPQNMAKNMVLTYLQFRILEISH